MFDNPILLVDFNNTCWRSAHAFRHRELSFEVDSTTVIYGLMSELSRLMQRFTTNRVILCGDHPKGSTKRLAIFPGYKNRIQGLSAEDLKFREGVAEGMRFARKVLKASGYNGYVQAAGYEADDLIAVFEDAYDLEDKVIVSSDRDLFQLLAPQTMIFRPGGVGKGESQLVSLQSFVKTYGITPNKWRYVKAIAGCTSDKVPGMKGVGESTAIKYLLGKVSTSRKDKIDAHRSTSDFGRDLRLVTVPFDDNLSDKASRVCEKVGQPFTEESWDAVCKAAGITSLPYPR